MSGTSFIELITTRQDLPINELDLSIRERNLYSQIRKLPFLDSILSQAIDLILLEISEVN